MLQNTSDSETERILWLLDRTNSNPAEEQGLLNSTKSNPDYESMICEI